jgi:hypothetical protein
VVDSPVFRKSWVNVDVHSGPRSVASSSGIPKVTTLYYGPVGVGLGLGGR